MLTSGERLGRGIRAWNEFLHSKRCPKRRLHKSRPPLPGVCATLSFALWITIRIIELSTFESLSLPERLKLQQLQQIDVWSKKSAKESGSDQPASTDHDRMELPDTWELTRGIDLHSWQRRCVDAWFEAGGRGVLKVVTGAGKTILALAIAEKLQQTKARNLSVAIVVPTIVLLDQWREEIAARSNLPPNAVGLLGGGSDDAFDLDKRILICVLNSAARKLPELVRQSGVGPSLLLIVDECHRAGAAEMRRVFGTRRSFSLGLSATPERENDPTPSDNELNEPARDEEGLPAFDETVLGQELGP